MIESSEIIYERIIEKLWISSKEEFQNFISKLENKDLSILEDFDKIVESGKNLKLFFKELIFKIKDKIISELKDQKDISNLINIFDILDETYWKTKYSLDENTTFLVWILKIIWNQSNKNTENITQKAETKTKQKIEIKEKITDSEPKIEDLDDIFWSDFEEKNEWKTNKDWWFQAEIFINNLKQTWAKWALTMSLRWSKSAISWNQLEIAPHTKIARTSIDTFENREVMLKTLENMWFTDFNIIIK